jgi:hypothetical protein
MKILGLATTMLLLLAGCQSSPRPSAGMASVSIKVMAEPKAGVQTSRGRVMSYDAPGQRGYGDFERVDYSNLGQIVVWLEPEAGSRPTDPTAGQISVETDARHPTNQVTHVVSVGQTLILRNSRARPEVIYCVSNGNEFDGGSVPPGGQAQYTVKSAGLIEVLAESSEEPVARVYAAPTQWVKLTRAGEIARFNDLPPGKYRVVSWHPRLPGSETSVVLSPNEVTSTSIAVGVNSLPKIDARSVSR